VVGDAVVSARDGQQLPDGFSTWTGWSAPSYAATVRWAAAAPAWTRAIGDERLVEGAERSSMEELADWTLEADRIVTF
jgi:uncharacterized protein involved in oxidation of intracellular sulfur